MLPGIILFVGMTAVTNIYEDPLYPAPPIRYRGCSVKVSDPDEDEGVDIEVEYEDPTASRMFLLHIIETVSLRGSGR